MKAFPWLLAGLTIGAAAAVIAVLNESAPAYADGDVERAANKAGAWGAKQRVTGTGGSLLGSAKQKIGEATGNYDLADEGAGDQLVGHVKDAAGKVASGVSDVLKDINRS
ncbi:hypothetical protein Terro_0533 [Terriglobus roseus DSM 18391]|uniref:CsbD-like n=1 Tax=Terriglobus roseus (strain DSM 18391 / NRRL B-41598 / KBS 63) TaxID=926566 RepID=I3ZCA6_TERRK|nr:CsbD family protein [Terriglobus roseus]AFL86874.1 hypothetical protein Terro_0533 [Terriglobus roseus DSM 18391]